MASSGDARYKFTSKERDVETGYDYFGARYYDSRIGRWMSVDPLAEKYAECSPYNYVKNDPINSFDPNGLEERKAREYAVINLLDKPYGTNLGEYVCNSLVYTAYRKVGYTDFPYARTADGKANQIDWFKTNDWFTTDQNEGEVGDVIFFSSHEVMIESVGKDDNNNVTYKIMDAAGKGKLSKIRKDYLTIRQWENRFKQNFIGIGSVQKKEIAISDQSKQKEANQNESIFSSWKKWFNELWERYDPSRN